MIKNFPLRRMIEQLIQEGKISHKEGELFKNFENLPFNPTLEKKEDCLRQIKAKDNLEKSQIQKKIWDARRRVMGSKERVQILSKSIIFDLQLERLCPEKKIILKNIYLLILEESLKDLPK